MTDHMIMPFINQQAEKLAHVNNLKRLVSGHRQLIHMYQRAKDHQKLMELSSRDFEMDLFTPPRSSGTPLPINKLHPHLQSTHIHIHTMQTKNPNQDKLTTNSIEGPQPPLPSPSPLPQSPSPLSQSPSPLPQQCSVPLTMDQVMVNHSNLVKVSLSKHTLLFTVVFV